MKLKNTKYLVVFLLLILLTSSCSPAKKNLEDKNSNDINVEEAIIPANNTENGKNEENPENPYAFTGELTNNPLDEVNIYVFNYSYFRYLLPYDKSYSNELGWDNISSMLQEVFNAVKSQEGQYVEKDTMLVKEMLFNLGFPEGDEKIKYNAALKYITIHYKHPVEFTFHDFSILADGISILLNPDTNIVELYMKNNDEIYKYYAEDIEEYYDNWFADFLRSQEIYP
ncbi:hypothetical protein [Alkaliphilus serpentinus]|uniref:Uncharacterized protein n=1 Tax=Alkaliphilus serpentinus TaxID=1482731 RepID=A0A833MEB8_9FIRM|nr:hypothetical protein [Alkaliphilus serpentinus]KAB3530729.1 hypothetical protein F8153_06365 [Alkaliphilus serpentinus]